MLEMCYDLSERSTLNCGTKVNEKLLKTMILLVPKER